MLGVVSICVVACEWFGSRDGFRKGRIFVLVSELGLDDDMGWFLITIIGGVCCDRCCLDATNTLGSS